MQNWPSIVTIGVLATFTVVALNTVFNSYLRLLDTREARRHQRLQLDLELRKLELDARRVADDRPDNVSGRSGESIQKLIRELISLEDVLENSTNIRQALTSPAQHTGDELSDARSLVKEISHSLNTPLSQVEVALKILADSQSMSAENARALGRARSSVAVCKAYIQGFRQAVLAEAGEDEGSSESLREILKQATDAADVVVAIDIPDKLTNYTNTFLTAMLLPLIDNAIESAQPGSTVEIRYVEGSHSHGFEVISQSRNPLPADPYTAGLTTKPGHEGMGLVVVKRLVNSVPGGTVYHRTSGDEVTFITALPENP